MAESAEGPMPTPAQPDDRQVQVRMALITAGSGLMGAFLGAAVALVVALTQLSAQDKQVALQVQQDHARFLRDNRLDAYSDALTAFAALNSGLATLSHAGSVEVQLDQSKQLLADASRARQVSARTQLLSPVDINGATRALNKSYLDYLRMLMEDLRTYLHSGGDRADSPPPPSDGQLSALTAKGDRYDEWLTLVRRSLQAGDT